MHTANVTTTAIACKTARHGRIPSYCEFAIDGKSNGQIGVLLKISPLTVKNHVQKILRKLNVQNRTQAVAKSLALRILDPSRRA